MRIIALLLVCLMLLSFTTSRLSPVKRVKTVAHNLCSELPNKESVCWANSVKASASHMKTNLVKKH